jgi:Cdc6-like AAA superfamily ATPase
LYDIPRLITDVRDQFSYHYFDVTFPPYIRDQLRDILEYRLEQAFYPHALDYFIIILCASLAAQ